jgi:hypothetical protein
VTGPVRVSSTSPPVRVEEDVDVRTRTLTIRGVRYEWVGPLAEADDVLVIEDGAVARIVPVSWLLVVAG